MGGFIEDFLGSFGSGATTAASGGSTGGGGGGGFSFSSLLPYAVLGGLQYLSTTSGNKVKANELKSTQSFNAAEAEKQRQFEMQLLQAKLAADQGAGGAANALMAKKALADAYAKSADVRLQGGQLTSSTILQMLQAIQNGLGQVR